MREPTARVAEALAVTIETCGTSPTPAAIRLMGDELAAHPEEAALKALSRCAREVTGRLSLAHIIQRIDDGRPTADEAWAQVGTDDENVTFVTTTEAMEALGAASMLMREGDMTAARMAFRDAYNRIVTEARGAGLPVRPHVSLGFDKPGRVRVLMQAVQAGRVEASHAANLLGVPAEELMGQARPRLAPRAPVAKLIGQIAAGMALPCADGFCDGHHHYDRDPELNRRTTASPCPRPVPAAAVGAGQR